MKLFLICDTGVSGHGTVGREFMKHLLDEKDIQLNVSTHQWGINLYGWEFGNRQFPDYVLKEKLIQTKRINPDYLLKTKRDFKYRPHNMEELSFSNLRADPCSLLIKDFREKEDINIAIGGIFESEKQPKYAYRILETTQNTTSCPKKWIKHDEDMDEIWVPCNWAKNALLNVFDEDKIKIIPYGVDFIKPTFNDSFWKLNYPNKFVFGTVARWENLKAIDILVKAYINEFTEQERVVLFIKTTINQQAPLNAQMVTQCIQQWISEEYILDAPEIGLSTDPINVQVLWDMLNAFDCFVLPSRAEAVGISIIQAMGLGKPAIATDYSAIKEYLNNKTGFPVRIDDEIPVSQHCKTLYFYGDGVEHEGKWAQPSQEHLQEQMRKVYEMSQNQPEKLNQIAEKGKQKVREMFNWRKHMMRRMKRFEETLCRN